MNASIDKGKEATVTTSDKSKDVTYINDNTGDDILNVSHFAPNQHSRGMIPWW